MIEMSLSTSEEQFCHKFHVVSQNFPVPGDGILGMDFLHKFGCVLDFSYDPGLTLTPPESTCSIKIPFVPFVPNENINYASLPPRAAVLKKLNLPSKGIFYVESQHFGNIFVAKTIIDSNSPYIRILNTNEKTETLDLNKVKFETLENFDVYPLTEPMVLIEGHKEKVLSKLEKNFPTDPKIKKELVNLCGEFHDIFVLEDDKLSANNFYKQKLVLKNNKPVYTRNYRLPHTQIPEVNKQVQKLIRDDLIEPSSSPFNSPLLLVPKKPLPGTNEKRYRLVLDYRKVNELLVDDKYPLPRMDELLDNLGKARFFSSLDLFSGFTQIPLEESSRDITSFSTPGGAFRFKRLPQGLKIGPSSFQRMMNMALSGLNADVAFAFQDDVISAAATESKMLDNLRKIFEICRKYNLKLNPEKCLFFRHEVTFLGHKCSAKGLEPDEEKIKKVRDYPVPKNADEAKRFAAFVNYFRKFIPNFADYARHITRLTKKNVDFVWSEQCEEAFNYLKNTLINKPILQYPDYNKQFILTTDASKKACGAVLGQELDGKVMPIAYASRSFTKGESNKSVIEQELAAIHWAIKYFRPYLYGTKFLVQSDHRPLTYLFNMKDPNSKLTRMRLDLAEYDFDIEYIPGKDNVTADALSRIDFSDIKNPKICKVTTRAQDKQNKNLENKDPTINSKNNSAEVKLKIWESLSLYEVRKLPNLKFTIKEARISFRVEKERKIEYSANLINCTTNDKLDLSPVWSALEARGYSKIRLSKNDIIFEYVTVNEMKTAVNSYPFNLEIVLTPHVTTIFDKNVKDQILKSFHDNPIFGGHPGYKRLYLKIRNQFYWKNLSKDVKNYVKTCESCQKSKITTKPKEQLKITDTPQRPFDIVSIDTIGPMTKSHNGNIYAITMICNMTKYLISIPIPDKSMKTVSKGIFENFILIYGPPKQILTDRGTEYENSLLEELTKLLKIDKKTSTSYRHQTLGIIERSHRTLNEYLRSYLDSQMLHWDVYLKYFTYCFNTTPSTTHGYCPFELVFAKQPNNIPFLDQNSIDPLYNIDNYAKESKFILQQAHKQTAELLLKEKNNRKRIYDKKSKPQLFEIGDLVLLERQPKNKHAPQYAGPFKIIDITGSNCTIQNETKTEIVHKERLKSFHKIYYFRFI